MNSELLLVRLSVYMDWVGVRSLISCWLSCNLVWLIIEDKLRFFHGQRWKLFFFFLLGDSQTIMLVKKRVLLVELDPFPPSSVSKH